MSCIDVPPLLGAPVLDQKAVQDLQELLVAEATWIEKVFAIARVGVSKVGDSVFRYPQVWKGNTVSNKAEYMDIRPDDTLKCYSFFEVDGQAEFGDDDEVTYPLSLIVWYNLAKLNGQNDYDYSRELAGHIMKVFDASIYKNKISGASIEFNPENIFSKYSMAQEDTQFLMYPYGAFKISFNFLNYVQVDCLPDFAAGTAGCEN